MGSDQEWDSEDPGEKQRTKTHRSIANYKEMCKTKHNVNSDNVDE
jgi:hypothetical protein